MHNGSICCKELYMGPTITSHWPQPQICRSKSPVAGLKLFQFPPYQGTQWQFTVKSKIRSCERGINVKHCKYKKCISADVWNKFFCFITKWEEVWWAPIGRTRLTGSWAWHHNSVPCLGPQSGLYSVSVFPSQQGRRNYKLTFMDQEDVMCGSIWSTIGFLSLKQISAFKHQWNTNKQNTASISTW